jgi:hypothetical protein
VAEDISTSVDKEASGQQALLIPLGTALIGLGNSFRMMHIPVPVPSGGGEPTALG